MSINFLHPALKPEIECNSLASEGFELSNLISENLDEFHKGFLVERFVSGPVFITIKFICPITIRSVLLWPTVGAQRSIGFELQSMKFTRNTEPNEEYQKLTSGMVRNEVEGIAFHREGFTQVPQSFHRISFRNRNNENITYLRIKIFRSQCVAAVKKLQIWGEPGYLCERKIRTEVFQLWQNANNPSEISDSIFEEQQTPVIECFPCLDDIQFPEEFHDEITHEVMTLPVILPSGKVIDQRTLDKCQKEEANWGRPPSDPFTGLPFTNFSKPVINTQLKAQIDEFLLKHADLNYVKTLPRRLGSDDEFSRSVSRQFKISKIVKRSNECDSVSVKRTKYAYNSEKTDIESQDDLEKMLSKTLSNLPSFLRKPELNKPEPLSCINCNVLEQLYKLPCEHILCRNCCFQRNNNCNNCNKSFSFAEVHKIHLDRAVNFS